LKTCFFNKNRVIPLRVTQNIICVI
jgi:hypothetical protein